MKLSMRPGSFPSRNEIGVAPAARTKKARKSSGEPRWSASVTRAVNSAHAAGKSKPEAEKAALAAVKKLAGKKGVAVPDAENVKPLITSSIGEAYKK